MRWSDDNFLTFEKVDFFQIGIISSALETNSVQNYGNKIQVMRLLLLSSLFLVALFLASATTTILASSSSASPGRLEERSNHHKRERQHHSQHSTSQHHHNHLHQPPQPQPQPSESTEETSSSTTSTASISPAFENSLQPSSFSSLPPWIIHYPPTFHNSTSLLYHSHGYDCRENPLEMMDFLELERQISHLPSDGELRDALEHFFWGLKSGLALELKALDGSLQTFSVTWGLEKFLNWKRILIEGDLHYQHDLQNKVPEAFSIQGSLCLPRQPHSFSSTSSSTSTSLTSSTTASTSTSTSSSSSSASSYHYIGGHLVGGIVEFMDSHFLKIFHHRLWKEMIPPGNISSITDWGIFEYVYEVECHTLDQILKYLPVPIKHIHLIVIDLEVREIALPVFPFILPFSFPSLSSPSTIGWRVRSSQGDSLVSSLL